MSASLPSVVITTGGTFIALATPGSCLMNSSPSMIGTLVSQRIKSTWFSPNTLNASALLHASNVLRSSKPGWRNERPAIFRMTEESSTMKARISMKVLSICARESWLFLVPPVSGFIDFLRLQLRKLERPCGFAQFLRHLACAVFSDILSCLILENVSPNVEPIFRGPHYIDGPDLASARIRSENSGSSGTERQERYTAGMGPRSQRKRFGRVRGRCARARRSRDT